MTTPVVNNNTSNPNNQPVQGSADQSLIDLIRKQHGENLTIIDASNLNQTSNHWIKGLHVDEKGNIVVDGVNVDISQVVKHSAAAYIIEPVPKPVAPNKPGKVWGDPHFEGFDGSKFDFQGISNRYYQIIKDGEDFIFNAKFISLSGGYAGATVLGEAGITLNGHKILFKPNSKPTIDNISFDDLLKNGQAHKVKDNIIEYITANGDVVKLNKTTGDLDIQPANGEYKMTLHDGGNHINYDIATGARGVLTEGGTEDDIPTGILGQTTDDPSNPNKPNESFELDGLFESYQKFAENENDELRKRAGLVV